MSDEERLTNNKRLMAAAREDNPDMLQEVLDSENFDINYQDGLGNTALHVASSGGCLEVLELILSADECDVDPINRIEGATPLHLAVLIQDPGERRAVVESLLDAGADPSIKNKHGETVLDLLSPDDPLRAVIRKSQAQATLANDDIASDDDDGEPGSGSDED